MRRLAVSFLLAFLLVGAFEGTPAGAQPSGRVTMTLVGQPAWNGPDAPLDLAVRVTNDGPTALGELSIVVSIQTPARSRSVYELSLREDATTVFDASSYPQTGTVGPGASRAFHVQHSLDRVTARGESALYPLRIDLLAADELVATVRTPMVFLTESPRVPLNLAWTWVLSVPLQERPDGVLLPGPIEADIAAGGRLSVMIGVLDRAKPVTADVVVSPVLVSQLARMSKGYRSVNAAGVVTEVPAGTGGAANATRVLEELRSVARRSATELSATPFGDARIPAILKAGLGKDLTSLLDRGRTEVGSALGVTPSPGELRPPQSQLDPASLGQVVARGAKTLLVDPDFVPPPAGLQFSPPSVALVAFGSRSATAILPDTGVATVAQTYPQDPVLAAHAALGELAARWFEAPSIPGRGAAMLFPEDSTYPTRFSSVMSALVGASPWLQPVHASELASLLTAGTAVRVPSRTYPQFDAAYAIDVRSARRALRQFDGAIVGADRLKETLATELLTCGAGTFVDAPSLGRAYLDAVTSAIGRTYGQVVPPDPGQIVTLASRRGTLPITIRNDSSYAIRARVRLQALRPGFTFDDGNSQPVMLPPGQTVVLRFAVSPQTTGRFPLQVTVQTPGGSTIAQQQMVVRSTAYNRVALLLTIGAAVFLAIWWGRRFLPRRKAA